MVAPKLPALTLAVLLAAAVTPGVGQTETDPLTPQNVLVLHRAGLSAADILEAIQRRGATRPTPEQRVELKAAGVPEEVLHRITPPPPKPLSLEDVLTLLGAGVSEQDVIQAIVRSGREFPLDLDRTVDLARRGVPPAVLKALREAKGGAAPPAEAPLRTLDDVVQLVRSGAPEALVRQRIAATRPPLAVSIDDLIRLSGEGLPEWVLKALLSAGKTPPAGDVAPPAVASARSPDPVPAPSPVFLHEEPGDGFSLLVPQGWSVHREQKGHNSLVSFTDRPIEGADDLPDGEIQVFRFLAKDRNKLTSESLPAIADNFLSRLLASYRARGSTFEHRRMADGFLAGAPSVRFDVTSATSQGRNQRGEIHVTFRDDVVYVLAYAAVPGSAAGEVAPLARCVRSFALPYRSAIEIPGEPTQGATALFDLWKRAVTQNDAGLYDRLSSRPADATQARSQFCDLAESLSAPKTTLELAGVARTSRGLTARVEVGRDGRTSDLTLHFADVAGSLLLDRP